MRGLGGPGRGPGKAPRGRGTLALLNMVRGRRAHSPMVVVSMNVAFTMSTSVRGDVDAKRT